MRQLGASEKYKLTKLVSKGCHPDEIDEYLLSLGVLEHELDAVYEELGLSLPKLRARCREKKRNRYFGVALALLSLAVAIVSLSSSGTVVVSTGVFCFGLAMAITGENYLKQIVR